MIRQTVPQAQNRGDDTMKKLGAINGSKKTVFLILAVFFAFILVCNLLTPMVADDFSYSLSWKTGERIQSIGDIIESLQVHYRTTNGRMIVHFLVHLFLMLPQIIFKLCNTCVFIVMLVLLYGLCKPERRHSALLLLLLFGLIWCATPEFGQAYFWLAGSCNYLWGAVATLLYLFPLFRCLTFGTELRRGWGYCILTLLLGFIAGAFIENVSAAMLLMAVMLLVILRIRKTKVPVFWDISVVLSVVGYLTVILAPGESKNKYTSLTPIILRQNFTVALNTYWFFWLLLLVLGLLVILSLLCGCNRSRVLAAAILSAGSLAANFIFTVAAYYPKRAAFYSVVLLAAAITLLIPELLCTKHRTLLLCAAWGLCLLTSYKALVGTNDIFNVLSKSRENEAIVQSAIARGETEVVVNRIYKDTPYAVITYYVDDPDTFPNSAMAAYYGLDSYLFK